MSKPTPEDIQKMYQSLDTESKITAYLESYIEEVLAPMGTGTIPNDIDFKRASDPNFVSILATYKAIKSQEKLGQQNNNLQTWLVVFSAIAVLVPIAIDFLSKFRP